MTDRQTDGRAIAFSERERSLKSETGDETLVMMLVSFYHSRLSQSFTVVLTAERKYLSLPPISVAGDKFSSADRRRQTR